MKIFSIWQAVLRSSLERVKALGGQVHFTLPRTALAVSWSTISFSIALRRWLRKSSNLAAKPSLCRQMSPTSRRSEGHGRAGGKGFRQDRDTRQQCW